jgi:hypothetical protein
VYREEALEKKLLTLEHVPPASVGGKGIVLTCHACNSKAGYTIEAELNRRQELLAFAKSLGGDGTFTGRVRLEMSGTSINVEATIENGKIALKLPKEINNPRSLQAQLDRLNQMVEDNTWDGYQFRMKPVTKYSPRLANLSYLKAAYLSAFASLGYSYIVRKELEPVRKQIASPGEKIIELYIIELPLHHKEEQKMIAVEWPFKATAVQFGRQIVFLPPEGPSEAFYENLPQYFPNGTLAGDFKGSEWSFPSWLHLQLDNR